MYCEGNVCWCMDVGKGHEIEDTRGDKDTFHCTEQGEKVGCSLLTYSNFHHEVTE